MLRKDDNGNIVFACQSHCGSVHDFELAGDNLVKTDGLKLFSPGIGFGVRIVNAVNLSGFENNIALHFGCPERSAGVRRKIRISGTGRKMTTRPFSKWRKARRYM